MNASRLDPPQPGVKRRGYDASRRQAAATATQARVLQVAERLFLTGGYAATSVAAIAATAGVSPELVYKAFGGKAGLVREIQRRGLLGGGPTPAPERSDAAAASHIDGRTLLEEWTQLSTEVAPRVAPIMLLVRTAAATDADLVELLAQMAAERLDRMTLNAERLRGRPGVRSELSVDTIRDVLWTYTSPDLYELLVDHRGWTLADYRDFLLRGLTGQLLDT
jgi:AcrR family transcriptional regulator